jgi:diacylglycerol O-acyltransferase / wax synthase
VLFRSGTRFHKRVGPDDAAWNLVPNLFRPVIKSITSTARAVVDGSEALLREGLTMALRPRHLLKRAKQGMSVGAALTKLALLSTDSDTSLNGELTVAQRAAWSQSISLSAVKRIGQALDAKVNDVLLGAVAGALRHYLQRRGEPVDGITIRALIPVNLRSLEDSFRLGNRFGLVFLRLPVGLEGPEARVLEVKRQMDEIKGSSEAVVALGILQVVGSLPLEVENEVVKLLSSKASAVMTNVPGPRAKLHMKGRRLQYVMPWVPRAGKIGLGVSVFSYADEVLMGVACDAGLVPNPDAILNGFTDEFEALRSRYA